MSSAKAAIKKPNVELLGKLMRAHWPILSGYAKKKLGRWYWEDEPKWMIQQGMLPENYLKIIEKKLR